MSLASFRVRVIKSEDDVLVVCPTILTEDGMQAQHLGATLALYRLVKGQVSFYRSKCLRIHLWSNAYILST